MKLKKFLDTAKKSFFLYLTDLNSIFSGVIVAYKNFPHWLLSKTIIYIYSWVLWFVMSIPFLGIIAYLIYKVAWIVDQDSILRYLATRTIDANLAMSLFSNIWLFIGIIICWVIIISLFLFSFVYWSYLQQGLMAEYLKWWKYGYFQNKFLSLKHMSKYLWILTWVSLYVLIPVLVAFVYILIVFLLWKIPFLTWIIYSESIFIWILHIIVFAWIWIYLVNLLIRASFSYIIFINKDDLTIPAKEYVKESLALVKWKVWKVILIWFPFAIISIAFQWIYSNISWESNIIAYWFNIFDFIVFDGISLMIYLSIFKVIWWNPSSDKKDEVLIDNKESLKEIEIEKQESKPKKTSVKKSAWKDKKISKSTSTKSDWKKTSATKKSK